MLSPALDLYRVNATDSVWLAPNVDMSWGVQLNPRFGLAFGLKGGIEIAASGHDPLSNARLSGHSVGDIATYLGTRF